MKIAYLIQDFFPEVGAGPARVLELSRSWKDAGAEVTVITGMPNRRLPGRWDGEMHPDYRGRLFMDEEIQGLRVLRSWLFTSTRRGLATTVINNASFMATAFWNALRSRERWDVLIASGPPFLGQSSGWAIARARRMPLVVETRDLWPDYMVDLGIIKGRVPKSLLFSMERGLFKAADHVVTVTESFRSRIEEKGVPRDRISVISNGVDPASYYPDAEAESPVAELEPMDREDFVVGYLGTMGRGQGLEIVVEAAALLEAEGVHVRFVLAGDGPRRSAVEKKCRQAGVRNVTIVPPIPRDQTRAFYNKCDACVVPLAPIPTFQETVPSKLFEIMACGNPVIVSADGEAARIVEESGGGLAAAAGSADSLARAIRYLRGMTKEERFEIGRAARAYVLARYDRGMLADRYLDLLHEVTGASRRPVHGGI